MLAVTGVGGDVLFVETTAFPTGADAEPGLTLTGQLGDVMKESGEIVLSYLRANADPVGLPADDATVPDLRRKSLDEVVVVDPVGEDPRD